MLGDLSAKYESNGDPGCISSGVDDPGGKSYGAYQLASAVGSLGEFVSWLQGQSYTFSAAFSGLDLASDAFDAAWKSVAQQYPDDFLAAQHDYIKAAYYDPSVSALAAAGWHIENHAAIMQDVIWSRAVQFGVGNIVDMWNESCSDMGYPNLSYIDAQNFDHDLIVQIYQTCISWNGSLSNRFISERADALAALGT